MLLVLLFIFFGRNYHREQTRAICCSVRAFLHHILLFHLCGTDTEVVCCIALKVFCLVLRFAACAGAHNASEMHKHSVLPHRRPKPRQGRDAFVNTSRWAALGWLMICWASASTDVVSGHVSLLLSSDVFVQRKCGGSRGLPDRPPSWCLGRVWLFFLIRGKKSPIGLSDRCPILRQHRRRPADVSWSNSWTLIHSCSPGASLLLQVYPNNRRESQRLWLSFFFFFFFF